MKSAFLVAPEKIEIREIDIPNLSDHGVLIQLSRAGICGSDVSLYLGHRTPPHLPFTIGHEFVGRAIAVAPEVTKVGAGQRVIGAVQFPNAMWDSAHLVKQTC